MQSLLRTRPENLDDLTVQVALVRPGPIQGKAVHPYIEQRPPPARGPGVRAAGRPRVAARAAARDARRRRLPGPGARRRRCASAGFTVGEAEGLRRAMSRKRSRGGDRGVPRALRRGRLGNGVDEPTADAIYDKLVGFSGFGFPKSHAAAFGLLAYQSAWLRHHYPAEFLCALLNAQPMGFYPPAIARPRRAAARGRGAAARREPSAARSLRSRTARTAARPCGSASATSGRWGPTRRRRSSRTGRPPVREPTRRPRGRRSRAVGRAPRRARGGRRGGRLRRVRARGASCSGGSASRRGRNRARRAAARSSSRSRSSPTAETPELPAQTDWERMLADYRHTPSRSASTRSSSCARTCRRGRSRARSCWSVPHGAESRSRAWRRPPAAVDRERHRLHAARGRARPGQPDRAAAGLRAHRAIVRGEPLLLARGRFERSAATATSSSARWSRSARSPASWPARPRCTRRCRGAHHFGHR